MCPLIRAGSGFPPIGRRPTTCAGTWRGRTGLDTAQIILAELTYLHSLACTRGVVGRPLVGKSKIRFVAASPALLAGSSCRPVGLNPRWTARSAHTETIVKFRQKMDPGKAPRPLSSEIPRLLPWDAKWCRGWSCSQIWLCESKMQTFQAIHLSCWHACRLTNLFPFVLFIWVGIVLFL